MEVLLVPILAILTVGGIAYAVLEPFLSGAKEQQKRRDNVVNTAVARAAHGKPSPGGKPSDRRKQIADTLREIDEKNKKNRKVSLKDRLKQAGMSTSPAGFIVIMLVISILVGFVAMLVSQNPFLGVAGLCLTLLFIYKPFLNFRINKRKQAFLVELPNAIDVVTRGIKSGLPLSDCFKVVAKEANEPLRSEFREAVDAQILGTSLGDALERMFKRMPLPEVNFLAIVITIQQSSGGNLAEALGNLSRVIRERKKMRDKINAVSQEAKSSAAIIGALPIVVAGGLYLISPDYVGLMFTTSLGNYMLMGCGFWMMIGVLIMAKMINFDI